MTDDIRPLGQARTALPSAPYANGTQNPWPADRWGHQFVAPWGGAKLASIAQQGAYFTATNATLGTAITGTAAPTAFSATVALMSLYNSAAAGGKDIVLDYLHLQPKAAGTNGTNFLYAMSGDRINRYSSGGTAVTPVNPNMLSDATSLATLNVGALTAAAAGTSVRRLAHGQLRTVIKVIGDSYLFTFGDTSQKLAGIPLEGTTQAALVIPCPPVIIGPGCSWLFHEIAASQSVAATWEFSMGWWEA